MKENKSHLINYTTQTSVILGVFWILKYLLVVLGGNNTALNLLGNLLSFGTPLILFYFLVRYNSEILKNKMRYWHGVQFSILLFFFASILEAMIVFIHVRWLDPTFISSLYNSLIELAQTLNISQALTTQLMEQPLPSSFSYVFNNVILADVFLGLILSLFIVPLAKHFKLKH